jgi:hypothetical protein
MSFASRRRFQSGVGFPVDQLRQTHVLEVGGGRCARLTGFLMAKELGRLRCEACYFDFEERYGSRGKGFIEAHHTKPVETLVEGSKTKLDDLALLCANCHRMVHSTRPWLSIPELRELIQRHTNAAPR